MQDDTTTESPTKRGTRTALKVALVGAGIIAGAIGATAIGANAADNTTTGSGTSAVVASGTPTGTTSGTTDNNGSGSGNGHGGPGGQRSDETVVTDPTLLAKLKAGLEKALPGYTGDKFESDSGPADYEAHASKGDVHKTVKFDANGNVTSVEEGMGK